MCSPALCLIEGTLEGTVLWMSPRQSEWHRTTMRSFVSLQIHLPVVVNSILPTQLYDPQFFILVQPCAQGFAYEHPHLSIISCGLPLSRGKSQHVLLVIPKTSLSLTPRSLKRKLFTLKIILLFLIVCMCVYVLVQVSAEAGDLRCSGSSSYRWL